MMAGLRGMRVSSIFVAVFLCLIMFSCSVYAFSLDMNVSNSKPQINKPINFGLLLNVPSFERVPVDDFTFEVFDVDNIGPAKVSCNFYVNGTGISGCNGTGVIVTKISVPSNYANGSLNGTYNDSGIFYSWLNGFGYSNGNFVYNIFYNTSGLSEGNYVARFRVAMLQNVFTHSGTNFTIMEPISLSLFGFSPSCVFDRQNLTVRANVTGSIKSVIVSASYTNGTTFNRTTSRSGDIYSAVVSGVGTQNLSWKFIVKDLSGTTITSASQSIYFLGRTKISVSPSVPNGMNGWYITEPFMSFSNPDAFNISYRWNSGQVRLYSDPFNLTNIPNPPPQTAGSLRLTYWSETSCGVEAAQTANILVDLTTPVVGSLIPLNGATINNRNPKISAVVDEIYGDNSGINTSSLVMKMDNVSYKVNTTELTGTKTSVYRSFTNLSAGRHNVSIYGMDNSGRSFNASWSFDVVLDSSSNIVLNNFFDDIYGIRQILFNISTNNPARIEYSDNSGRWMSLCVRCTKIAKRISFVDGYHDLVLRATDIYGNVDEKTLNFSIDSKKPRISSIKPRSNAYVNSNSEFYIKYNEENLKSIVLYYGNNITGVRSEDLSCASGTSAECVGKVNLDDFDGQIISYWFEVSDYVSSTVSRATSVRVDTTSPVLTIISPKMDENGTEHNYPRNILFNISMSEKSIVEYLDNSALFPTWTKLCVDCSFYSGVKRFSLGEHDLIMRASDKAGNSDEDSVSFFVV